MFLLTETIERVTRAALFPTREAAQKVLEERYEAFLKDYQDDVYCSKEDGLAWITAVSITDGYNYDGYNYDWSIIDLDEIDENSLQP